MATPASHLQQCVCVGGGGGGGLGLDTELLVIECTVSEEV